MLIIEINDLLQWQLRCERSTERGVPRGLNLVGFAAECGIRPWKRPFFAGRGAECGVRQPA